MASYYGYSIIYRAYRSIAAVIGMIRCYLIEALRFVGPLPFDLLQTFSLVAFRKIGILSPTYRESYDTHGLSLAGRRT